MPPGPLRRARAERWRSLSSSVRAAVSSCFLHGFCTNGLGDTGFVLLCMWYGMVANGRPWGRHHPGGRGSPADDAVATTSTIHLAAQPQHTTSTHTHTQPLSRALSCTPLLGTMVVWCALQQQTKAKLRRRFLSVSDAFDVHGNGQNSNCSCSSRKYRIRTNKEPKDAQYNREYSNATGQVTMVYADELRRQRRLLKTDIPEPAHGSALEGGC